MALFDFTPDQIAENTARGTLLQPSWYTSEIIDVDDSGTTQAGDEITKVIFKCLDGRDPEDKPAPGVRLYAQFMPKYPQFAINFVNALGANLGTEGKKNVKIDKSLVGRKLMTYVVRGEYKGKSNNQVEDYRPAA